MKYLKITKDNEKVMSIPSTRKIMQGWVYQDLYSVIKILDMFEDNSIKHCYIEFEEALYVDDVVVVKDNQVIFYQLKHSVDNENFTPSDFFNQGETSDNDKIKLPLFKKLYEGWIKCKKLYPNKSIKIVLKSNRNFSTDKGGSIT